MPKLWRKISYYRHRSELWSLAAAKKLPLLAMFPIGICLMFWFYVASLPIMIPTIMLIIVYGDIPLVAHAGLALPSLALVFLITPWFFGWYITAASLMFGRSSRAQKKEQALIAAIQAYKTKAI